ncbi:PIG-L family deacetylase [Pseudochrobactrum asaccharolyticum]|uniref:LmbE family N-acetylglucosaminyl deacetylase n=1 Tax=Pseudochrobactrum asaccharolyticum TaxID=354351 RepID=A0A366E1D1_9HYPH|nr:PIG-L family deacetylase [Pseudochrobactrum asaccharolyticum]RBO95599.1 LmbE family N-acetylglucosaminyl deacetylase [Pseudochrobactrum asaccharolyticum]
MLSDRQRIEKQKSAPALIRLHHALSRLRSVVTVMNTGAHPDDEQSGLLAFFRFGAGMRVIVGCSTRGEGGQNALGPERGGALGLMRSREMEEAARELDCDIVWLGHGPDDAVHDFGFSKDGDRTFDRWGEDRIVERLVRAYRSERPDIVIPTFLDVPGQHGHHRAMTRAAERAFTLAANNQAFPEHFAQGLKPWQVAKYYLPAWSGGGDTYDDEVPPPETTLTVRAEGREPATGADYDRIGEWSRYYHASQGMGYWKEQPKTEWPLHLLLAEQTGKESSIFENLPVNLSDLATEADLPAVMAQALQDAQKAIDMAIAAFPAREAIIAHLVTAAQKIEDIRAHASAAFLEEHAHRLQRKKAEIDHVLIEAAAIFDGAELIPPVLSPTSEALLKVGLSQQSAHYQTKAEPVLPEHCTAYLAAPSASGRSFDVKAGADAAFSPLYRPFWSALGGNGDFYVRVTAQFSGYQAQAHFDLAEQFALVPAQSVRIEPEALIVPLDQADQMQWPVHVTVSGDQQPVRFISDGGWSVAQKEGDATLCAPEKPAAGLFQLKTQIAGRDAVRLTPITYPHIGQVIYREPEILNILALDLKLPQGAKIGYIGGGADRAGLWLSRMGLDVTELEPKHLAGDLQHFTAIVVGIFAFGIRPDLAEATARLHAYVENGGHLVTLYHRPTDGWKPAATPPRHIKIGSPSLRWRVTDPAAPVTVLEPEHKLLNWPNRITAQDWEGWNKERGLYFASQWDEAYQPLLSMHDANEQPLTGALLSARIGKGRHTHTSLVLHHQMDKLVAGAFCLMANLVSGEAE